MATAQFGRLRLFGEEDQVVGGICREARKTDTFNTEQLHEHYNIDDTTNKSRAIKKTFNDSLAAFHSLE
jgi:hypothetical protein